MLGRDFGYWNTFLFKYFIAFISHNGNLSSPHPHAAATTPPPPLIKLSQDSIDGPLAQGDCAVVLQSKSFKHFVI